MRGGRGAAGSAALARHEKRVQSRYRLRLLRPFLAPLRDDERRELFRLEDRDSALLRAELRLPFFADFLVLFLAEPRADFLAPRRAVDLRAAPRLAFLVVFRAALRLGRVGLGRAVGSDSSISPYVAGVEPGVGGVLSIGSGSIQPEPDQPISMK